MKRKEKKKMKLDYIREHNAFYTLSTRKRISPLAQLMWYKLFALNNCTYGDGRLQISNNKLSGLMDVDNINRLSDARSELAALGIIDYIPGKKREPGVYRINSVCDIVFGKQIENEYESGDETEDETEEGTEDATGDVFVESTYIYNKIKNKNKNKTRNKNKTPEVSARDNNSFSDPFIENGNKDAQKSGEGLFDLFWEAYPKKIGRENAKKAFAASGIDDLLIGEILSAVERACRKKAWSRENGRYIPLPERYITEKRWTDVIDDGDIAERDSFGDAEDFLAAAIRKGLKTDLP